ncbi:hypothetical protein BDY21DRAFT_332891 [Lineolata rhizophorae]|uniref:Uncharacterized protein n=1 Tax=Lineolata rhizophorae TaxID=578093 RepID=A0A6A6PCI7_9PEZI|nr:hypothetical protein BDY21DRAFT_332891 [Lineolata rhizophorae]
MNGLEPANPTVVTSWTSLVAATFVAVALGTYALVGAAIGLGARIWRDSDASTGGKDENGVYEEGREERKAWWGRRRKEERDVGGVGATPRAATWGGLFGTEGPGMGALGGRMYQWKRRKRAKKANSVFV